MMTTTADSIQLPTYAQRLVYRHGGEFAQWHSVWGGSRSSKRSGLNTKKYLGNINLLILQAQPSSREEWEKAYTAHMGIQRLREHSERFSARTKGELSVEGALTIILIHTVDETWDAWELRQELIYRANVEAQRDELEALAGVAADEAGRELDEEETRVIFTRFLTPVYELPTPAEFERWGMSYLRRQGTRIAEAVWVRPASFFAPGSNLETKQRELKMVLNLLTYQTALGSRVEASFVSYRKSLGTAARAEEVESYRFDRALAEVMTPAQSAMVTEFYGDAQLVPVEGTAVEGDGKGQALRVVTEEEMRYRLAEEKYQRERAARNAQIHSQQAALQQPTLF